MILEYNTPLFNSIYALGRMYYYHGLFKEAEKVASGLQALDDKNPLPKLLLAALNFEKGNYSLSANYYRILAQEPSQAVIGRLGLLASFVALKDFERASSLCEELRPFYANMAPEQQSFFTLFSASIKNELK